MKKATLLILIVFAGLSSEAQLSTIEMELSKLSGITYASISGKGDYTNYVLNVRQPLDHADTTKGFFYQKVFLSHKNFDRPTVMITAGYSVYRNSHSELTKLLEANQIYVEHRYFGESMPDSVDFRYLNLKQATADLHRIRQLFAPLYSNKWISTGISKGGVTTIFYRYFYPNDIDVSVPYVAPINQSYEEPRIYKFLDTIGTEVCRNNIKAFQTSVLKNREQVLPLIKFYSIGANATYSYLTLGEAFEYAVMEYPFSFWQWGHQCEDIPAGTASIEEMSKHLIAVSDPTFFSDGQIKRYNSHYYQSATEMGYYGYETSEFKDLLIDLPTDINPHATFFTFDMKDQFDGRLLTDVNQWLASKGDKMIYIYGGNDTWTASAVPPNNQVDAEWFIMPGKHHGNARIREMSDAEKSRLISTLEQWLSMDITPLKK